MNSHKLGSIGIRKVNIFSFLATKFQRLTAIAKNERQCLFYEICDCRFDKPEILLCSGNELTGQNNIVKQHVFYLISDCHLEMPHAFASGGGYHVGRCCHYYQLLTLVSNGNDVSSYQGLPEIMAVKSNSFISIEGQFKSQAFEVSSSYSQGQLEIHYTLANDNSTPEHLAAYHVSCQLAPNRPHNLSGYSTILASVPHGQVRHVLNEEKPLDKTYSANEQYWQEQKSP